MIRRLDRPPATPWALVKRAGAGSSAVAPIGPGLWVAPPNGPDRSGRFRELFENVAETVTINRNDRRPYHSKLTAQAINIGGVTEIDVAKVELFTSCGDSHAHQCD